MDKRKIQVLILAGLGVYLLFVVASGRLYYYINERFIWLVVAGGLIFLGTALALGLEALRSDQHSKRHEVHSESHEGHQHGGGLNWSLLIAAIPLLLGFLVTPRPLDASTLNVRGVSTSGLSAASGEKLVIEAPADSRNVLDWVRAFSFSEDLSEFEGEPVDLIGFVYQEPSLDESQFLVSRFTLSCCVADAFAIGIKVESEDAQDWASNQWVHLVGRISVRENEGSPEAVVIPQRIVEIEPPPQPYLFP